jgi:hypothetical protein
VHEGAAAVAKRDITEVTIFGIDILHVAYRKPCALYESRHTFIALSAGESPFAARSKLMVSIDAIEKIDGVICNQGIYSEPGPKQEISREQRD